jgi:hypothetical protein
VRIPTENTKGPSDMTPTRFVSSRPFAPALAAAVLTLAGAGAAPSFAATPHQIEPRVATGAATHVLGTSALLTATITPKGIPTSYYFEYGPSPKPPFAFRTPVKSAGSGETKVKVGEPISKLLPGTVYYFQVVATTTPPSAVPPAHVHQFKTKGKTGVLAFSLERSANALFGFPFILTGALTGPGAANHRIALQASPYPFLESFTQIGFPGTTNVAGRFSFRVANLSATTQFRVVTFDQLPVYSPVMTVSLQPVVTLHVRSSGQVGLVRLYGTITPAVHGARVLVQVQKAVRPGRSGVTNRYITQFTTSAHKGAGNTSRYSIVVKVKRGGRYHVLVELPRGPLASAPSRTSVILHAAPVRSKKH